MVYDAASLPDVSTNIVPPSSVVYMSRTWTMETLCFFGMSEAG
jgi:hypothetical protein